MNACMELLVSKGPFSGKELGAAGKGRTAALEDRT